jgi:hypothetical protein
MTDFFMIYLSCLTVSKCVTANVLRFGAEKLLPYFVTRFITATVRRTSKIDIYKPTKRWVGLPRPKSLFLYNISRTQRGRINA